MDVELVSSIALRLASDKGWGVPVFIDAGASGAVYDVLHNEHGRIALKIYDPKFFEGDNALIEERRVALQTGLVGLEHPNLIRTIAAEPIADAGTWYILMEFCAWPSLEKQLANVSDEAIPRLIAQLTEAVLFLQQNDLVHRDIKPANIAVSPDFKFLKLLDFGVLRHIAPEESNGTDADEKRRFVATTQYSPPEYIVREEKPGQEGFEALNVYQVGAVLHDLIMKQPLFAEEAATLNRYILYKAVLQKRPTVFSSAVPARLGSLCRAALEKDPARRVAGVRLSDFLIASENAEALRRRLSSQRQSRKSAEGPSAYVWKRRVEGWLAAAARAEREILGAFSLADLRAEAGCAWRLSFPEQGRMIYVQLVPEGGDRLLLTLGGMADQDPKVVAFEVLHSGPNVPMAQMTPQLSEQILGVLDSIPVGGKEPVERPA